MIKRITLSCVVVLLGLLSVAAYSPLWLELQADQYVEHVVLFPARSNQSQALGAGFPDIELYEPGANLPRLTSLQYDASTSEVMDFTWHPLHQTTRTGTGYVDLHYSMASAHAGTVRMKLSMWTIAPDEDLAALGAADVTTSWTVDPNDAARISDANFYTTGYSGTIRGTQMGQFDVATLGLTTIQNEVLCRLERDAADATLDTHTGALDVYRVELHYPISASALSFGE